MINKYLDIKDGEINFYDGVFMGVAPLSPDEIAGFCLDKAEDMRHSDLGNYEDLTTEEREELAKRWEAAEDLPDGEYQYYFNLEDKAEVFKEAVEEFAQKLGIKYELKLI